MRHVTALSTAFRHRPAAIRIILRNSDGDPVRDEEYEVEDPEGNVYTGATDSEGRARIDGLPPGNYTIRFPRIPGQEFDTQS